MGSTGTTVRRARGAGVRAGVAASALAVLALAGCGDDDESAQDAYCEAGEALRSSLASLTDLDLVAQGTDGLNAAVEAVQEDVGGLRDAASDATADEVDALGESVDDLEGAISDLGGELTSDNAAAVSTAVQEVASAARAVLDTLSDC